MTLAGYFALNSVFARYILGFLVPPTCKDWSLRPLLKNRALKVYDVLQFILCNVVKHYRARNAYQNYQQHRFWHSHASEMSNWMNLWFGRLLFEQWSNFYLNPVFVTFWPLLPLLICIIIAWVNRALKYKHFEWVFCCSVAYTARDTVIFVSHTP